MVVGSGSVVPLLSFVDILDGSRIGWIIGDLAIPEYAGRLGVEGEGFVVGIELDFVVGCCCCLITGPVVGDGWELEGDGRVTVTAGEIKGFDEEEDEDVAVVVAVIKGFEDDELISSIGGVVGVAAPTKKVGLVGLVDF